MITLLFQKKTSCQINPDLARHWAASTQRDTELVGEQLVPQWIVMIAHCVTLKERIQFDRPIGGFQLQQKKLAEMVTEITKAQLMVHRLGQLKNEGKATTAQISMAKRNSVDMALKVAREGSTNSRCHGHNE